MRRKINLSRPPITPCCLVLLFLSPLPHRANAQLGTESPAINGPSQNFSQSMAVVIAFLMCAFFFLAFFSIYCRECLDSRAAEAHATGPANRSRNHGLDPAVIETFPILVYSAVKELKIGKGALECAVCLSEFEDYETLRLLPKCSHVFHPDCIDGWLASRSTCPVCRAKLTPVELASNAAQSTESSQENSASENGAGENNDVLINVGDDHSRDCPARTRILGKFPRSHSTGHSLVQSGENTERYTLRLPEEVRKQIVVSGKLRRSSSYDVVLGREGSSRGKNSGVDRQVERPDWWVFSRTPPFVSVRSPKLGGEGNATIARSFLTSVKKPLDCLGVKSEGAQDSSVPSPV